MPRKAKQAEQIPLPVSRAFERSRVEDQLWVRSYERLVPVLTRLLPRATDNGMSVPANATLTKNGKRMKSSRSFSPCPRAAPQAHDCLAVSKLAQLTLPCALSYAIIAGWGSSCHRHPPATVMRHIAGALGKPAARSRPRRQGLAPCRCLACSGVAVPLVSSAGRAYWPSISLNETTLQIGSKSSF